MTQDGPGYKDFIVTDKFIWALTSTGKIKLFDKSGNEVDKHVPNASEILLLAKDHAGNPVVADKANEIKRYDETHESWSLISKHSDNLFGFAFDRKNVCYLITESGIRDVKSGNVYYSKKSVNSQITYRENKWGKPYCYYMDRSDRIWLGFGYGEWGGDLFVFETSTGDFLTLQLDSVDNHLMPIKSFFEDSSSVYLSASVQHMATSGTIVKFDRLKAEPLLESGVFRRKQFKRSNPQAMTDGEYIGPATYNEFNKSIYFYSQTGIHQGKKNADLSQNENWNIILKPKLRWKYGQPDAVGAPMNVLKIVCLDDDKLIFLSQHDGIGYFDGKELRMLN